MQVGSTRSSCNRCRAQKLRCERQMPDDKQCERCRRAGVVCVFGQSRRGRRPSGDTRAQASTFVITPTPTQASLTTTSAFAFADTTTTAPLDTLRPAAPSNEPLRQPPPGWVPDGFHNMRTDDLWSMGIEQDQEPPSHTSQPGKTGIQASSGRPMSDVNSELRSPFTWEDMWAGYVNESFQEPLRFGHSSTGSVESASGQLFSSRPGPNSTLPSLSTSLSPGPHILSVTPGSSHSRTSQDWFYQCFRELSSLDVELVNYNASLLSDMESPERCFFEYLNTMLMLTQKFCVLLNALIQQLHIEERQMKYQESNRANDIFERHSGRGVFRGSKKSKHSRSPRDLSPKNSSSEHPVDVATLISIMATHERLIGIYKSSLQRLMVIMKVQLRNWSSGKYAASHRTTTSTPLQTRANSVHSEEYHGSGMQRIGQESVPSHYPWSHLQLPGLAVGAFYQTDPQLQLDAILHILITLLRRVGTRVQKVVLLGAQSNEHQKRKRREHRRSSSTSANSDTNDDGDQEPITASTNNGDADSQKRLGRRTSKTIVSARKDRDGTSESTDEDDSSYESEQRSRKDDAYGVPEGHPDAVVNSLLQRVRELEKEVAESFASLQETISTFA